MDYIQIIVSMEMIGYIVFAVYIVCLVYITVYCLLQFHLLLHYTRGKLKDRKSHSTSLELNGNKPFVTIQLPVFNEYFVVERLIDNICKLDYPWWKSS